MKARPWTLGPMTLRLLLLNSSLNLSHEKQRTCKGGWAGFISKIAPIQEIPLKHYRVKKRGTKALKASNSSVFRCFHWADTWRMPHTTLMHLLWTWLLLESQKGATLYFCVMFLEQQLPGNFTEYRTRKLEPNYSMNTNNYGSDYTICFTSCTIRYHSQWDRKHSGYPCQCIQVLPAWLSPVFMRLAWGWEREVGLPEVDC